MGRSGCPWDARAGPETLGLAGRSSLSLFALPPSVPSPATNNSRTRRRKSPLKQPLPVVNPVHEAPGRYHGRPPAADERRAAGTVRERPA